MAAKVAQAVPDIIDCDRVAVFLDTVGPSGKRADGFRLAASSGYSDEEVAAISSQTVHGGTAPTGSSSRGSSTAPVPSSAASPRCRRRSWWPVRPIGSIVASVTDEPERLTVTPRLADRLKGLAAQASTAISNARLVDQIRFQAVHDALTGLPNRALILDRTEQMLARARRSDSPGGRPLHRPRRIQGRERHPRPRRRRPAPPGGVRTPRRSPCGRATASAAWAATSSSSWSTGAPWTSGPSWWPSDCSRCSETRSSCRVCPVARSASPASIGIATGVRVIGHRAPPRRRHRPLRGQGGRQELLRGLRVRRCTPPSRTAICWRWTSARPWPATSTVSSTSPSSIWPGARPPGSRPCCAGTTRERGLVQPDVFIPVLEDSGHDHRGRAVGARRGLSPGRPLARPGLPARRLGQRLGPTARDGPAGRRCPRSRCSRPGSPPPR